MYSHGNGVDELTERCSGFCIRYMGCVMVARRRGLGVGRLAEDRECREGRRVKGLFVYEESRSA